MYKIVNGIEKIDKEDLALVTKDQDEAVCEGRWKIHFPYRTLEK
ncbi:hypothetical protein E2C01_079210 [Portunus trituberculatus]|uniref:Uncharacterized protein n=1 Tax=Portunus trituberculatus TaxID=210409 RepID=A0A5B7IGC8_PORTR|nr:hypothetical protein [Portunus trituberculatus]